MLVQTLKSRLATRRADCRACGGNRLRRFLVLGPTPLANAFPASPADFADECSCPLDVFFCETCSLVQLLDVVEPEVLFRDYIYVTGTSDTMAAHNRRYAGDLAALLSLRPQDLVVEVASNDGSLLDCFRGHGVRTLGIEPATNVAWLAEAKGIETLNEFFDARTASAVRSSHGPARAVVANNVLAHVDGTAGFLRACRELLSADGLLVVEAPYVGELIERLEYDTIYHEHLCYFSVKSLARLCEAAGLCIVRLDRVPVHGGSLRMYAAPARPGASHSQTVDRWIADEGRSGLDQLACYNRFAGRVERSRRQLLALLKRLRAEGRLVAGYGAPAKGNTLLNYCGIGPELLAFTVDKHPWKVGRYTPGMHVPVLPVAAIAERMPDYLLILAWNFAEEIMQQQREFTAGGGRFILPLPEARIV